MPATRSPRRLAAAEVEVEYVVNNAGFGLFGRAIERGPRRNNSA